MEIAFRLSIFIFILNFITIYLISNNILIRINNKNRSMKYIYIYIIRAYNKKHEIRYFNKFNCSNIKKYNKTELF